MIKQYCLYLRKSRADLEAEQYSEGETLARHETTLLALSNKMSLDITEIYKEIVSGDSIASRPVMQNLLSEVEQGKWAGVLVMEVERLARGDTIDQGIMAQAFKYSGTKIITPMKTYDPANEFDEEFFEFGLFMSRREYKTINRRLQRGRLASVREGKYVGSVPPYGYKKVKLESEKGYTLQPIPDQADTVKLIFELFINPNPSGERMGALLIAKHLNKLAIPSATGTSWTAPTIKDILQNPVYIGKIRWNWRKNVSKISNGQKTVSRPRNSASDYELIDGLHRSIVDESTWNKTQDMIKNNSTPRTPESYITKNPLAGLVVCNVCGKYMIRKPDTKGKLPDSLICNTAGCKNVASYLYLVEQKVLDSLKSWLDKYKIDIGMQKVNTKKLIENDKTNIKLIEQELTNISKQINKLHDFLEQGIYDTNTFLERSKILTNRKNELNNLLNETSSNINNKLMQESEKENLIPQVEELLQNYQSMESNYEKNQQLKLVISVVTYDRPIGGRWQPSDNFTLKVLPRIPKSYL